MATKSLIATGVLGTDRRDHYISPQAYAQLYTAVTPFVSILQAKGTKTGLKDPSYKMLTF